MAEQLPEAFHIQNAEWFNKITDDTRKVVITLEDASRAALLTGATNNIYESRRLYDEHMNRGFTIAAALVTAIGALIGYGVSQDKHVVIVLTIAALLSFFASAFCYGYCSVLESSYNLYFAATQYAASVQFAFGFHPVHKWTQMISKFVENSDDDKKSKDGKMNLTAEEVAGRLDLIKYRWLAELSGMETKDETKANEANPKQPEKRNLLGSGQRLMIHLGRLFRGISVACIVFAVCVLMGWYKL